MPESYPSCLSPSNHTNLVRWGLNLLTNPQASQWLLDEPMRFASLFAMMSPHVVLPEALLARVSAGADASATRVHEIEELRSSGMVSSAGRVSPKYIEALLDGMKLAEVARKEPEVWEGAMKQWARDVEVFADEISQSLSEYAQAIAQAPSLMAVPPAPGGKGVMALFHTNLALFLSASEGSFTLNEIRVLEVSFCQAEYEAFKLFFEVLADNPRSYGEMLSIMLDVEKSVLEKLVSTEGRLARLHLVPFDPSTRRILPLAGFWHEWFGGLHESSEQAVAKFLVPLRNRRNAGALARLPPSDTEMVSKILMEGDGRHGTNVLLYGPKSIDKLGWVHALAKKLGRTPYTLPHDLPDMVLPSVCHVAQRLLSQLDKKGWLVLSKADSVLTRTQRGRHQFLFLELEFESEVDDGAGEADLLARNPVPSVWLVNSPDRISEDNVGRFLYTCEMKAASRSERRQEISGSLEGLSLSEEFLTELSQHAQVGKQQLESAAELVWRFAERPFDDDEGRRADREALARRAIEQSQKALNRRKREDLRQPVTQYSLDYLNIRGVFPTPKILSSLRRSPNASLCFYGIPGTGKTQLAEHIAVELDKPIIIKRASDILGKFVGENEKNIKLMFEEAQDEDAVLLLDEADSFLRDRNLARQSWEVSTVNELLQGMERHRGVFICTTNLFSSLDLASLRRFTFKLEFLELNEDQRWQMFLNESGFVESSVSEEVLEVMKLDLNTIRGLAPGDFATIQRQLRLMQESLGPDQWIAQLRAEARAKMREAMMAEGGTHTL